MTSDVDLMICVTCQQATTPAGADHLGMHMYRSAQSAITSRGINNVQLKQVECMSVCKRACTVAVSAPGKWTYIIGDLDAKLHMDDLLSYVEAYAANEYGTPPLKDRPACIKRGTVARIPPNNATPN